jgi:hypothetical protein
MNEFKGDSDEWINSGYTLVYDWQLDGLTEATITQSYMGKYSDSRLDEVQNSVGSNFNHNDVVSSSTLKCVEASGSINGVIAQRTLVYKGIPETSTGETTIKASLSKEPIETHPNFEEFAGTPDAPVNNAVFNDDKTFSHFKSVEEDCPLTKTGQTKFGVKYYLEPTLTVEQTKYKSSETYSKPETGKIEDPEKINCYGSTRTIRLRNRDFLVTGETASPFGKGIKCTKTFLASGYNSKWNDEIYES